MRSRLFFVSFGIALSAVALPVFAQPSAALPVHVFVREGCIHCAAQEEFMAKEFAGRADVALIEHDIGDPEERALFDAVTARAKLPKATPVTFIGGTVIQGFATADTTGKRIMDTIEAVRGSSLATLEDFVAGKAEGTVVDRSQGCDESGAQPCTLVDSEYLINVPFIGSLDVKEFSLPVIAAILGFVDGFNPCALWVLVTFLLVLLQLNDRAKVWKVAGLFIAAETIMYYLILNVWFTTWDFIGLDRIVTPIVGLVAVGAGIFFLYEAKTSAGECKVVGAETRKRTNLRIRDIASRPFTLMTALAVIGLALSVNIIEFACSIGIPQTFTKILDLNNLSLLPRQGLMALYILMYMIDDFLVFGLALWSTEHMYLTSKYSRICNIIGGSLMILLGILLVFAPNALKFS